MRLLDVCCCCWAAPMCAMERIFSAKTMICALLCGCKSTMKSRRINHSAIIPKTEAHNKCSTAQAHTCIVYVVHMHTRWPGISVYLQAKILLQLKHRSKHLLRWNFGVLVTSKLLVLANYPNCVCLDLSLIRARALKCCAHFDKMYC